MRRIFVLLGLSVLSMGPTMASPALTAKPTILRATASSHGKVIQAIPGNAQVDVNNCGKAWCFVSWREKFGYIPVSAVAALPQGQAPSEGYPSRYAPPYNGPYPYPYDGYGYGGYGYGYGYGGGYYGGGWGHRRW